MHSVRQSNLDGNKCGKRFIYVLLVLMDFLDTRPIFRFLGKMIIFQIDLEMRFSIILENHKMSKRLILRSIHHRL